MNAWGRRVPPSAFARYLAASGLLVTALALNACDDDTGADPLPWLPIYAGEPNADGALLQGLLARDGDCLYVQRVDSRILLGFPAGAEWDGAAGVLRFDGFEFAVGGTAAFGGSLAFDPGQIEWSRRPDGGCEMTEVWLAGSAVPGT